MGKHVKETPRNKDLVAIHVSLVFDRTAPEANAIKYSLSDTEITLESFEGYMEEVMAQRLLTIFGLSDKNGTTAQKKIREKMMNGEFYVL